MSSGIQGRIVFLDYMRIFAFASVLVGHKLIDSLNAVISDDKNHITLRYLCEALHALCVGGGAGVVVFFLTSGYIITHVLQKESPSEFLIKRAFRIYPLYILAVILEVVLGYAINGTKIPSASTMIPRLLLIGDFFQTPTGLANVEWTLRIEVLFYVFMALIKKTGALDRPKVMPVVYTVLAAILFVMPLLPARGSWNFGYVNAYTLFLLIGSMFYLAEQRLANITICISASSALLVLFLVKTAETHPFWKDSNFAIIATIIFGISLLYRSEFKYNRTVGVFSNLTFSVYLFHNWLWEYIAIPVSALGATGLTKDALIILPLFSICYLLHMSVERRFTALGRKFTYKKNNKASAAIITTDA